MRTWVRSLASLIGFMIWHCCELWCRSSCSSDPALLWLWSRPASAALIRPLAWELSYDASAALIRPKKKKKNYVPTHTISKCLGQGSNLSHSCDLHYSCRNADNFNPLHQARDGTHTSQPKLLYLDHCGALG